LMLLRMVLLALLALAFARPFQEIVLGAHVSDGETTHHVILLDASLSMGADGVWEEAQRQAVALLNDVKAGDWVGLIRFAQQARVDVPLTEDINLIRQAIGGATWTWEKGDDLVGLQASADMLAGEQNVQRVVHLMSDFQATGLPEVETGWALPGHIKLHPVVIGNGDWGNASVDALALRSVGQKTVQVRARIKNWQGLEALKVNLWLDDKVVDSKTFSVAPGHASQVRFDVPEGVLQGFVEVGNRDGLLGDNRHYFVHQLAPKHRVLVLQSGTLYPLMQAVIPDGADLPWQIIKATNLVSDLSNNPAVVVAGSVGADAWRELKRYVESGGCLFLPLEKGADASLINQLLQGSGVQVQALDLEQKQVPLAWVDLKHRIFYPFRGAQFNDFSSIRYTGYHRVL
ncbi:MAG: vWA domain-containing protein, partial [Candidatus Latescibacterota bacterium]